jgi:hypothetical protein
VGCYARNLERRRARSILLNSVSGTKQLSGNGVAWSASISPFSPLPTSLLEEGGGLISACACADCMVFCLSVFLGLCPSTLRRIYRVACRHFRRRGELRLRQSSSTRTRLFMLMLMRENVIIMMVVRRPHRDRKPIQYPPPTPNVYCTIFFHTSYTVPAFPIPSILDIIPSQ